MSKAVKEMMTHELASRFEGMDTCLVVGCEKLSVTDSNEVRYELFKQGLTLMVVKNSLATRALERVDKGQIASLLDGPSAFLTGNGPVETAKAFTVLAKAHSGLVLRGAYADGQVLDADGAKRLAAIPPREVLLAQILAGIQAPLSGLAGVLSGVHRQLAMVMKAAAEAGESSGEEAGESP